MPNPIQDLGFRVERFSLEKDMIARVLLDRVEATEGEKEFRLFQRGEDFFIFVGNDELMSSRMHESEEELARLTTQRIKNKKAARVLIGGLGMGFTLRAALDELPATAEVVVAECVSAVVRWNRDLLAGLTDNPLADKRVDVREVDVIPLIKKGKRHYDAILLDVDNGPGGLSQDSNEWLYSFAGLRASLAALRPKGVLAVWSVAPDVRFTQRLKTVGFNVAEIRARARAGRKGAHHHLWIAAKR